MPIIRAKFGNRGLGCPCEVVSQRTLGQDSDIATPAEIAAYANAPSQAVPGLTPGVPAGTYSTAQLIAADAAAGNPAAVAAAISGTALPATSVSLGTSAASSLNDFVYNIDTTWVWIGGAAILGLFLWKKKKR
jgi:hypothetical protein